MIFDKVAAVLAEKTGTDVTTIQPGTTFEELKLDSLDTVDVLMSLEDVFDISLEMSPDIKGVGDIGGYL